MAMTSGARRGVEYVGNGNVEFVAPGLMGKPNGGCRVAGGGVGNYREVWQATEGKSIERRLQSAFLTMIPLPSRF
jgi:hypothetical protein